MPCACHELDFYECEGELASFDPDVVEDVLNDELGTEHAALVIERLRTLHGCP